MSFMNAEECYLDCSSRKTRKRLTLSKRLEIHTMHHIKTREKAQEFFSPDMKSYKICEAAPPEETSKERFGGLKRSKHFKGNKKGAGKLLSYLAEIEQEIIFGFYK